MGKLGLSEMFFRCFCVVLSGFFLVASLFAFALSIVTFDKINQTGDSLALPLGGVVLMAISIGGFLRGFGFFDVPDGGFLEINRENKFATKAMSLYLSLLAALLGVGFGYSARSVGKSYNNKNYLDLEIVKVESHTERYNGKLYFKYHLEVATPNSYSTKNQVPIPDFMSQDPTTRTGQIRNFLKTGDSFQLVDANREYNFINAFLFLSGMLGCIHTRRRILGPKKPKSV